MWSSIYSNRLLNSAAESRMCGHAYVMTISSVLPRMNNFIMFWPVTTQIINTSAKFKGAFRKMNKQLHLQPNSPAPECKYPPKPEFRSSSSSSIVLQFGFVETGSLRPAPESLHTELRRLLLDCCELLLLFVGFVC